MCTFTCKIILTWVWTTQTSCGRCRASWSPWWSTSKRSMKRPAMPLDDSTIKFDCQYLPLKPIKWGIKIWVMAASSTAYCANLQVYTACEGPAEKGPTHRGIMDFTKPYYGSHLSVYMDNCCPGKSWLYFTLYHFVTLYHIDLIICISGWKAGYKDWMEDLAMELATDVNVKSAVLGQLELSMLWRSSLTREKSTWCGYPGATLYGCRQCNVPLHAKGLPEHYTTALARRFELTVSLCLFSVCQCGERKTDRQALWVSFMKC